MRTSIIPSTRKRKNEESASSLAVLAFKERILLGYTGASLSSDLGGIRGVTTAATVSSTVKVGSNSLSFNNQNSASSFRLNEILCQLPEFSIGCWLRYNSFNYGGAWASWSSQNVETGQILLYNDSGTDPSVLSFWLGSGSNLYQIDAPSGLIQLNTWYWVVCEASNPESIARMYINNNLVGSVNLPSNFSLNTGTDTFSLGGYNLSAGGNTNFNGYMEQFFVASENLSVDERAGLYNNGAGYLL